MSAHSPTRRLAAPLVAPIGIAGGFLSGLLGIGGGTAMVPLLVMLGGMAQRDAHAVSLAAMIPIAAAALIIYGGAGKVQVVAAGALLLGSLAGARLGAALLSRASEGTLKRAFGVFLLHPIPLYFIRADQPDFGAPLVERYPHLAWLEQARGGAMGWGLANVNVNLQTGEYGWDGTAGTIFWIDPVEELIPIMLIQITSYSHLNIRPLYSVIASQAVVDSK